MKRVLISLAAGALALAAQPQPQRRPQAQPQVAHDVVVMHSGAAVAPPGAAIHFERSIAAPVKGAPFSAESVTESVQVLGDGNRITHKQTGKSYRDGEGRTRTENQIESIGPWTPDEGFNMIAINDPVARLHIMLNSKNKTATKVKLPATGHAEMSFSHSESQTHGDERLAVRIEHKITTAEAGLESVKEAEKAKEKRAAAAVAGSGAISWTSADGAFGGVIAHGAGAHDVRKESLGKQTMEGLEVDGTRETMTIPAGSIGNERAIEVVTETWRSAALQMDVLRKHTDPRYGTTTYRLTAVNRAEPAKTLFEVPADYKVDEPKVSVGRKMILEKEGTRKQKPEIF